MQIPTKPDALIFDFDGTLADTFQLSLDMLYELAHRAPLPPENLSVLRGMTMWQVMRRLSVSRLHALLLWRAMRREVAVKADTIELVSGVPAMVQTLAQRYPLYIVTANTAPVVAAVLERYNIAGCFTVVRGGASPLNKTGALRRLARSHGLQGRRCWYIGDQASDVVAAKRAGMHAVAVTWGFNNIQVLEAAQPDLLAFTPAELLHFLHIDETTS